MGKAGKIGCGIGIGLAVIAIIIVVNIIGAYNGLVKLDESVNQSWAQVQNVYQRRSDLIPNLVETVKGYAAHEKETFTAVTQARARMGGVTQLKAGDLTKENLAKFQQAQAGLGAALQRLMVVSERYPELKANQNFTRLQDELAGTENRITVERRRFNEAVQGYNQTIRTAKNVLIARVLGFERKEYFEAEASAQKVPEVKF
ncbi:LemA family protein [bacterium]|nr:LemA family protein [bacterium]